MERIRELVSEPPSPAYFEQRAREGWTVVAVEWVRRPAAAGESSRHDTPYGLRVAGDCLHLEEDPDEMRAMATMLDLVVRDLPLGRVCEELNRRGFRTRDGAPWTQKAIFELLPRLIEAGPQIFTHKEWEAADHRPAAV